MHKDITNLITQLGHQLKEINFTLVTAESCTGGGLAYFISMNPQASFLLERGYVTYSNHAKQQLLAVKPKTLQTHGAVSREVALEMAEGALKNSAAQVSIAITGIAGPDKDDDKHNQPGEVWICCASFLHKPLIEFKKIDGQRQNFCEKTILESLQLLLKYLEKIN